MNLLLKSILAKVVRVALVATALVATLRVGDGRAQGRKQPAAARKQPPAARTLEGLEALRYLHTRGEHVKAEQYAYHMLWSDIRQSEVMWLLADSLGKQGKKEDAAVFLTMMLQIWNEDSKGPPGVSRKQAESLLAPLNKQFIALRAEYVKQAPGKRFDGPEKVDDGWMTQVKADLTPLHGLYAWKLVGGRQDAKPDWIHNRQGTIHRSGLKYVDEVDGRKGVLFGVPLKLSHPRAQKTGHGPHVTVVNVGRCPLLRVGVKGYNFSFVLKILDGDRELFSQEISPKRWSDLKIPLGEASGKAQPVVLELLVPEKQGPSEGVWFDYIDFFEN
jgi:hypothetical protein